MLQKFLRSSSKLGTPPKLNPFHIGCRNCSKSEQFRQQQKKPSFKASHSVNFLLTNSQLVLFVCLSCLVYSLVRVGTFSCFYHSLVRVRNFFLVEILPFVNNFDKN